MRAFRYLALLAALPLASCGGGGGDGGGVTSPTPPPTGGAPTPTPTPIAEVRFTLEAAGGTPGAIALIVGEDPNPLQPSYRFFTDLSGSLVTVGTKTTSPYGSSSHANGAPPTDDYSANYALWAYGHEKPTRLRRSVVASRRSTTVSPLTALSHWAGSQQAVKNALGLGTASTFAMPADLNFNTYSASQDIASGAPRSKPGQVFAANVRIAALEQAIDIFRRAPATPDFFGMNLQEARRLDPTLANYIKANPAARLDTAAGIRDFLRQLRSADLPAYREDVLEAAGALIHNFGLATQQIDNDPARAPAYSMAVMGALRPRLLDLAEQNSAAAAARAGVASNILQAEVAAAFTSQLAFPNGKFIPVPDFFRMAPGTQLKIFRDNTPGYTFGNAAVLPRPNMTSNDIRWGSVLEDELPATIGSIQVPAEHSASIRAVLQADGSVLVTAQPGFTGIAWYDYVSTLDGIGETETGRVYLFVR